MDFHREAYRGREFYVIQFDLSDRWSFDLEAEIPSDGRGRPLVWAHSVRFPDHADERTPIAHSPLVFGSVNKHPHLVVRSAAAGPYHVAPIYTAWDENGEAVEPVWGNLEGYAYLEAMADEDLPPLAPEFPHDRRCLRCAEPMFMREDGWACESGHGPEAVNRGGRIVGERGDLLVTDPDPRREGRRPTGVEATKIRGMRMDDWFMGSVNTNTLGVPNL